MLYIPSLLWFSTVDETMLQHAQENLGFGRPGWFFSIGGIKYQDCTIGLWVDGANNLLAHVPSGMGRPAYYTVNDQVLEGD